MNSEDQTWSTRTWLLETLAGALVGLVCVGVALLVLRMNPYDMDLLRGAGGDITPVMGILKGTLEGYDITINPNLGFPGFMDSAQFPLLTDAYHWAHLIPMARVFSDAITAVNLYVFVGFFEVGLSAYLLLRLLGVYRSGAVVLSAALTLLPWTFERGSGHVFLANYAPAVVGVGLVIAVWRGYFDRVRLPRIVGGIALALVAALGGIYYAFMTSLLLAIVLGMRVVFGRADPVRWTSAVVAIAVPAFTVVGVVLNRAVQHSSTVSPVSPRSAIESTTYSGSLATLFLPHPTSLFGKLLEKLRPQTIELYAWWEGNAAFNVVVIMALILVLGVLVVGLFRPARTGLWLRGQRQILYLQGLLLIVVFMYANRGGGALFAYLATPEIRAWGRYSVFIAVLAALAAGVLTTALLRTRRRMRIGLAGAAAAILALETLSLGYANFADSAEVDYEIRPFVRKLEGHLTEGCPILQLPLMEFPEAAPINRLRDYSLMIPYLVSEDLRWSYGGVKGTREGTWGLDLRDDIQGLADAGQREGFCGVVVDTTSFASPADLQRYTNILGAPDLASERGRWLYFEWLDDQMVPTITPVSGFSGAEGDPTDLFWWQVEGKSVVALSGMPAGTSHADLEFGPTPCGPVNLLVNDRLVSIDRGREWVQVPIDADALGEARLEIEVTTEGCSVPGDPRVFYAAMFDGASVGTLRTDSPGL